MMRTRWRFGSNRRFVATIEWLRLCPNDGFLPQIAQILDIDSSLAGANGAGADLGEQVGHLERSPCRLGALADTGLRLRLVLDRQEAERDGDTGLDRGQLQAARGLAGDEVEVRCLDR